MNGSSLNPTPVRVGMKAKLLGRTYEVTGRLVAGVYEEGERYDWQEFQLVAGDGSHVFLEFDEGRWRLMHPLTVSRRMTPAEARTHHVGSRLTVDGRAGTVTEVGTSTVQHVEGRFRWDVEVGDVSNYVDARLGTAEYTIEWSDVGEVEYFRGQHLSRREVYAAFGLTEALGEISRREETSTALMRFAAVAAAMGLAALLIWAITGSTGDVITRGSVTLEPGGSISPALVGGRLTFDSASGTVFTESNRRVGPFRLESGAHVYRISVARRGGKSVSGTVEQGGPSSGNVVARATTLPDVERASPPPPQLPPPQPPGPMPSAGLRARRDFRVPESGDYFIRLAGDTGTVEYELRGGVFHRRSLLWYAVAALLLGGGLVFVGSRSLAGTRWWRMS